MIKPIGDRLLVEKVPAAKSVSGIVLPDTAIENDARAVEYFVIAVGEGRWVSKTFKVVPEINPKDFILASNYAGKEVVSGNRKLRLIEWGDVLAQVIHADVPAKATKQSL